MILNKLGLIILFEGFVSIAIEILTIRQLLPFAGGSVIVTSLVIGIFLLFLALGYRKGGRITNNLQGVLRNNFLISSIWLGIGLSYFFILIFFNSIQKITGNNIVYPLIAYLLIVIAPLVFILGQTVPISMNMAKKNLAVGMIGGDTLGLSTLGSFLGATITALVLMNYIGVACTVFSIFMMLVFLSLLLSKSKLSFLTQLALVLPIILLVYDFNIHIEKGLFQLTNNYANYQLMEGEAFKLKSDEKILSLNHSFSSYTNKNKKGFAYVEAIKKILFNEMMLRNAEILVLGAGGFTLSAENTYNNHFTYVDIDGKIKKVVIPRFLKQIHGDLIVDDARHYIHSTTKQYHAIVVDAYSNTRSIPAHLLTHEFISELKKRLYNNGIVIFNIIGKATLADSYSKRIDNTIRHTFKNCMVIPLFYGDRTTNILYACSNASNQIDQTTYTDDLNTSTTDAFAVGIVGVES